MKSISILLSCVLATQVVLCEAALAGTIKYDPRANNGAGSLSGEAAVNSIGKLKSDRGSVSIQNNKIDVIFASADLTQKTPVLTGTTFKTKETGHGKTARLTGLCFFRDGSSLNEIYETSTTETVKLTNGDDVTGTISDVTQDSLRIDTPSGARTIDMANVDTVLSPRVFRYSMSVSSPAAIDFSQPLSGDAAEITFAPTGTGIIKAKTSTTTTKTTASTSTRTGRFWTKKKVIITIVAAVVIAAAIAIPIAVACGTAHHHGGGGTPIVFRGAPPPAHIVVDPIP